MAGPRRGGRPGWLRLGLPCVTLSLVAMSGSAAAADLQVREVYPGSAVAPAAEYVELQMTANGQGGVAGREVILYGASGSPSERYTLPNNVANGQSQRTVLLATPAAEVEFEMPADFLLPEADALSPAAGAACFTGGFSPDCVTWGSFPVMTPFDPFPNRQSANAAQVVDGMALRRSIARGCPISLDGPDDTNDSRADFEAAAPAPRANFVYPSELPCAPDTAIKEFPANPTNSASASFSFVAVPEDEEGVTYGCSLDDPDPAHFTDCTAGARKTYAGPLADGVHTFRVAATGPGGTDPTPATYTWTVDTVPPQTFLDSFPPDPSSGFTAAFSFHSSEPGSSFRCQLDGGEPQACFGSKTYINLGGGRHTFRVWAVDNAGNEDPNPATYSFTVDKAIEDTTPPDTIVVSSPPDPSASDEARFTYRSTEDGSTFECGLDGATPTPCPAEGISYAGLRNGRHTFRVAATDPAGNRDPVPAAYSWTVAASLPVARIVSAPPGQTTLRGGVRKVSVSFQLRSDKPGSSFRCRLDKQAFRTCAAQVKLRAGVGRHRFEAYAVDALGNVGTATARRIFRVRVLRKGGLF